MKNARDELDPAFRDLLTSVAAEAISMLINYERHAPAEAMLRRLDIVASEHGHRYRFAHYYAMWLRVMNFEDQDRWNEALEFAQAAMEDVGPEDVMYYRFTVDTANIHRHNENHVLSVNAIRDAIRSDIEHKLDEREMTLWLVGFLYHRRDELGEAVLAAESELREYARRYHGMDDAAIDAAWAEGVEAFLGRFFPEEDDGVDS